VRLPRIGVPSHSEMAVEGEDNDVDGVAVWLQSELELRRFICLSGRSCCHMSASMRRSPIGTCATSLD